MPRIPTFYKTDRATFRINDDGEIVDPIHIRVQYYDENERYIDTEILSTATSASILQALNNGLSNRRSEYEQSTGLQPLPPQPPFAP